MLLKEKTLLPFGLLLLAHFGCAYVSVYTDDFSSEPVPLIATVDQISSSARSVTECAFICKSADSSCKAFTVVTASGACLTSATWNADFASAAPGSEVFRIPTAYFARNVFVDIGNRTFRVIQQRSKGILSFARNWTDYEIGFGDDTDFWLGLRSISSLTANTPRLLRMEAVTWAGLLYISEYSGFTVGNASTSYTMTFSAYLTGSSNTSSDSLTYHKGRKFTTVDRDNDGSAGICPITNNGRGGFWYYNCAYVNPSGIYCTSAVTNGEHNMHWRGADANNALKSIRLMLQIS